MDTVIALKYDGEVVTVTCDKQKDAETFTKLSFELVRAGGSRALDRVDHTADADELTASDMKALEALHAITLHGESVPSTVWYQSAELPHTSFYRCRAKLVLNGYVQKAKDRYLLTDSGTQALSPKEVPF